MAIICLFHDPGTACSRPSLDSFFLFSMLWATLAQHRCGDTVPVQDKLAGENVRALPNSVEKRWVLFHLDLNRLEIGVEVGWE